MATTPLLLVTDAGLAAANQASPNGPYIHIVEFALGSAFGYEPSRSDHGLAGDVLYRGTPLAWRNIGNNTLDIIIQVPADAGPFDFGEVGIYNSPDGGVTKTLFAKAVFEVLQHKYSALGTNVASSFTIHALLKLEQSIAVFKIDTLTPNTISEVDRWSDVLIPSLSADPDIPLCLVRELDASGASSLLHYSVPDQERWTIGTTYFKVADTTVVSSTASTVVVPASAFDSTFYSTQDKKYVIEIEGRNDPFRVCASLVQSGANAVFTIHPDYYLDLPPGGAKVRVYESINFKKPIPLMSYTETGIGRPVSGVTIDAPGQFSVYGLVHGPGAGRQLGSADNLDNTALPSGEYYCWDGARPANVPPLTTKGGKVRISAFGYILQDYYPFPTPVNSVYGDDPNNQHWWRIWQPGVGWSLWRSAASRAGIVKTLIQRVSVTFNYAPGAIPYNSDCIVFVLPYGEQPDRSPIRPTLMKHTGYFPVPFINDKVIIGPSRNRVTTYVAGYNLYPINVESIPYLDLEELYIDEYHVDARGIYDMLDPHPIDGNSYLRVRTPEPVLTSSSIDFYVKHYGLRLHADDPAGVHAFVGSNTVFVDVIGEVYA